MLDIFRKFRSSFSGAFNQELNLAQINKVESRSYHQKSDNRKQLSSFTTTLDNSISQDILRKDDAQYDVSQNSLYNNINKLKIPHMFDTNKVKDHDNKQDQCLNEQSNLNQKLFYTINSQSVKQQQRARAIQQLQNQLNQGEVSPISGANLQDQSYLDFNFIKEFSIDVSKMDEQSTQNINQTSNRHPASSNLTIDGDQKFIDSQSTIRQPPTNLSQIIPNPNHNAAKSTFDQKQTLDLEQKSNQNFSQPTLSETMPKYLLSNPDYPNTINNRSNKTTQNQSHNSVLPESTFVPKNLLNNQGNNLFTNESSTFFDNPQKLNVLLEQLDIRRSGKQASYNGSSRNGSEILNPSGFLSHRSRGRNRKQSSFNLGSVTDRLSNSSKTLNRRDLQNTYSNLYVTNSHLDTMQTYLGNEDFHLETTMTNLQVTNSSHSENEDNPTYSELLKQKDFLSKESDNDSLDNDFLDRIHMDVTKQVCKNGPKLNMKQLSQNSSRQDNYAQVNQLTDAKDFIDSASNLKKDRVMLFQKNIIEGIHLVCNLQDRTMIMTMKLYEGFQREILTNLKSKVFDVTQKNMRKLHLGTHQKFFLNKLLYVMSKSRSLDDLFIDYYFKRMVKLLNSLQYQHSDSQTQPFQYTNSDLSKISDSLSSLTPPSQPTYTPPGPWLGPISQSGLQNLGKGVSLGQSSNESWDKIVHKFIFNNAIDWHISLSNSNDHNKTNKIKAYNPSLNSIDYSYGNSSNKTAKPQEEKAGFGLNPNQKQIDGSNIEIGSRDYLVHDDRPHLYRGDTKKIDFNDLFINEGSQWLPVAQEAQTPSRDRSRAGKRQGASKGQKECETPRSISNKSKQLKADLIQGEPRAISRSSNKQNQNGKKQKQRKASDKQYLKDRKFILNEQDVSDTQSFSGSFSKSRSTDHRGKQNSRTKKQIAENDKNGKSQQKNRKQRKAVLQDEEDLDNFSLTESFSKPSFSERRGKKSTPNKEKLEEKSPNSSYQQSKIMQDMNQVIKNMQKPHSIEKLPSIYDIINKQNLKATDKSDITTKEDSIINRKSASKRSFAAKKLGPQSFSHDLNSDRQSERLQYIRGLLNESKDSQGDKSSDLMEGDKAKSWALGSSVKGSAGDSTMGTEENMKDSALYNSDAKVRSQKLVSMINQKKLFRDQSNKRQPKYGPLKINDLDLSSNDLLNKEDLNPSLSQFSSKSKYQQLYQKAGSSIDESRIQKILHVEKHKRIASNLERKLSQSTSKNTQSESAYKFSSENSQMESQPKEKGNKKKENELSQTAEKIPLKYFETLDSENPKNTQIYSKELSNSSTKISKDSIRHLANGKIGTIYDQIYPNQLRKSKQFTKGNVDNFSIQEEDDIQKNENDSLSHREATNTKEADPLPTTRLFLAAPNLSSPIQDSPQKSSPEKGSDKNTPIKSNNISRTNSRKSNNSKSKESKKSHLKKVPQTYSQKRESIAKVIDSFFYPSGGLNMQQQDTLNATFDDLTITSNNSAKEQEPKSQKSRNRKSKKSNENSRSFQHKYDNIMFDSTNDDQFQTASQGTMQNNLQKSGYQSGQQSVINSTYNYNTMSDILMKEDVEFHTAKNIKKQLEEDMHTTLGSYMDTYHEQLFATTDEAMLMRSYQKYKPKAKKNISKLCEKLYKTLDQIDEIKTPGRRSFSRNNKQSARISKKQQRLQDALNLSQNINNTEFEPLESTQKLDFRSLHGENLFRNGEEKENDKKNLNKGRSIDPFQNNFNVDIEDFKDVDLTGSIKQERQRRRKIISRKLSKSDNRVMKININKSYDEESQPDNMSSYTTIESNFLGKHFSQNIFQFPLIKQSSQLQSNNSVASNDLNKNFSSKDMKNEIQVQNNVPEFNQLNKYYQKEDSDLIQADKHVRKKPSGSGTVSSEGDSYQVLEEYLGRQQDLTQQMFRTVGNFEKYKKQDQRKNIYATQNLERDNLFLNIDRVNLNRNQNDSENLSRRNVIQTQDIQYEGERGNGLQTNAWNRKFRPARMIGRNQTLASRLKTYGNDAFQGNNQTPRNYTARDWKHTPSNKRKSFMLPSGQSFLSCCSPLNNQVYNLDSQHGAILHTTGNQQITQKQKKNGLWSKFKKIFK